MVIYGIIWQQGDILTLEQISFIDSAITHWYCDIQLGTELGGNLDFFFLKKRKYTNIGLFFISA